MSPRSLLALHRAILDLRAKSRKVAQLETLTAEFDSLIGDLEQEIRTEEDRARIHDPSHFTYPTYARAASTRRNKLVLSRDALLAQLPGAKEAMTAASERLAELREQKPESSTSENARIAT